MARIRSSSVATRSCTSLCIFLTIFAVFVVLERRLQASLGLDSVRVESTSVTNADSSYGRGSRNSSDSAKLRVVTLLRSAPPLPSSPSSTPPLPRSPSASLSAVAFSPTSSTPPLLVSSSASLSAPPHSPTSSTSPLPRSPSASLPAAAPRAPPRGGVHDFPFFDRERTPDTVSRTATQCGRDYSASLNTTTDWSRPCRDFERSLRFGSRPHYNGPFTPAGECALRWFSPAQACDIVESLGFFLVLGDSITRQLDAGLHMVLSGDYTFTSPVPPTLAEVNTTCYCGRQFESHCPYRTPVSVSATMPHVPHATLMDWAPHKWCPRWKREHILHVGAGWAHELPLRNYDWAHYGGTNSDLFAYVQFGMWSDMTHPDALIESDWRPTIDMLRAQSGFNLSVMCGTEPACGKHKSAHHLPLQGNPVLVPYNDAIRTWCKRQGFLVFEQFNVTLDAEDTDGTHYTPYTNVALAQLVLNQVVRWKEGDTAAAPAVL